ncbi:MAG: lipoyl(octanoyl) transferase LipB [Myxococcota bacterium]
MNVVTWHRLGRVEYADGLELQRQFQAARRANAVTDTLLLLEHPPVLTLGRGAKGGNIIASPERLADAGVTVHETDRGGDVTYHGPGQLVGYPLLHLGPGRQDVRKYVRSLEEVILRTLADFGISATRIEKWPGVWVEASRLGGPRKICALGVHLSRWYTRHGFALNVQPALEHFELIIPCGIKEAGVTSMAAELGRDVRVEDVEPRVAFHFGQVFESDVREAAHPTKTISCVVTRDDGKVLLLRRVPERGGFWQIVTGRVEEGESVAHASVREVREETGLTLLTRPLDYVHAFAWGDESPPRIAREHAFAARAPQGGRVVLSPAEHDAFEWVTLEELTARVPWEGLRVAARRALAPTASAGQ